jgi:hypothetical protein
MIHSPDAESRDDSVPVAASDCAIEVQLHLHGRISTTSLCHSIHMSSKQHTWFLDGDPIF